MCKNHSPEFTMCSHRAVYNPKRKHTNNGMLSSVDLEERQLHLEEVGVFSDR